MREHQVVINLKAQQFELLQRLAREKGYKSVSAFVKEKLLELVLDVEEAAASENTAPVEILDSELVQELRKIQGELRALMQDSLGDSMFAQPAPTPPAQPAQAPTAETIGKTRAAAEFTSVLGGSTDAAPASVAASMDGPPGPGSDWSVSAGPVNVVPAFDVTRLSTDLDELKNTLADPPASVASEPPAPDSSTRSNQAIPSSGSFSAFGGGNLGGFAYGLSGFSGSGFGIGNSPGSDRLSGYKDILDDLEELADRAFAISPRLGALEEEAEPTAADGAQSEHSRGARQASETESSASQYTEPETASRPVIEVPQVLNLEPHVPIALVPPLGELSASIDQEPAPPALPPLPKLPPLPQPPAPPAHPVADPISFAPASSDSEVPTDANEAASQGAGSENEDDLLADLLDDDLVAHARSPRAENPFAVNFAFRAVESEAVSEPAEAQEAEAQSESDSVEKPETEPIGQIVPETDSVSSAAQRPDLVSPANFEESQGEDHAQAVSEEAPEPGVDAAQDVSASQANTDPSMTAIAQEIDQEPDSKDDEDLKPLINPQIPPKDESQDANGGGVSGFSGGPPPRRRRT